MVADWLIMTSTGDKFIMGINVSDLERPWIPTPNKGFSEFFTILGYNTLFKSELHRSRWR